MPQCVHVLANIDKCMLIRRHNVLRKQRRRRSDPRGPCGIRREGHTPRVNTPTGDASILPETSIQGCRQDTVWRSAWTAQARCCAAVCFLVAPAGCSTSQTAGWGPRHGWRCLRAMGGFFHFLDHFSHPFYNPFMPGDHTTIILQSIHEKQ